MFGYLAEQPHSNLHFLNRLIKLLNHFISIEPKDKPKGFECHHIVPRSWKPEWGDEKNNLLKLPAKAHYVVHHLMWKAFQADVSMTRAFWLFSITKERKITAKVYESLRLQFTILQSETMKRKRFS